MRLSVLAFLVCLQVHAEPLPALGADASNVTVSGVSSGGYMAVQLHVAHSATVSGVGVVAGGPYYCAQGSLWAAYHNCRTPGAWSPLPAVALLGAVVQALARAGRIDPPDNLRGARVWLFTGRQDRTVYPEVVHALRRFYEANRAKPVLVAHLPAGHGMVTAEAGGACSSTGSPFINDCDYDAAGELLKHLFGALEPASQPVGRLVRFDQTPFGEMYALSMDDEGFVYLPKACEAARCRIHVALHGCRQNARAVGERFVRDAGYNRWAESNRLIVLYPQTIARHFGVFNPRGCWDWWGYTGADYHTRRAPQIRAIKAMLDKLGSEPD
jgi:poly(3-hydroxybutyrate) depolymerase